MANFDLSPIPDLPPAPPPDPRIAREEKIANDTRVESELNRFIASKQDALFNNPDAFYRTQGEDAIHASSVATKNLEQLRDDLLDGLANDYQRKRLGAALDAQMQLTRQQMARHVAEQSLAWQRGVAQDRIAILTKEAAYHHNDTDLVDGMGHAAANAARAHARVGGVPAGGPAEDAAAATARSSVLSAAIQARLDRGDAAGADAMLMRFNDQLDPAHAAPLQGQIDTVQRGLDQQLQLNGDAPDTASSGGGFVLLPVPGSATIEPGPQPPPDQPPPDPNPNPPPAASEQPSPSVPNEEPQESPGPAVIEKLSAGSIALPQYGVPVGPMPRPLPATVAQLAARVAASAPGAATTAALAAGAAGAVLLTPRNFQGGTIELGDGLRAQWKPGQRSATIERRTGKGLFGSDVGAHWEELPVTATYEAGPDGRPTLFVDPQGLKTAIGGAATSQMLGKSSVAPTFQILPTAKPWIYEIRIGVSTDGGVSTKLREATDEEVAKYCPNYPRYQEIALRASEAARALGLPNGMPYGNLIHKMAESGVTQIALTRDMLRRQGILEVHPEFALRYGIPQSQYSSGSSVLDVLEIYEFEKRACVYDFKTGGARFPDTTIERYAREAGAYANSLGKGRYMHIVVIPVRVQ
jgi:hypothetical protein